MLKKHQMILLKMTEKRLAAVDLAVILDMNKGNLSKFLTGKAPISYKLALKLAAALDLNPLDLVDISKAEETEIKQIKKKVAAAALNRTR